MVWGLVFCSFSRLRLQVQSLGLSVLGYRDAKGLKTKPVTFNLKPLDNERGNFKPFVLLY